MSGVLDAACEIQQYLQEKGWPFCIIGGIALARWGKPRATGDVDISLLTGFGEEEKFLDSLLARFSVRMENSRAFALTNRVLLLQASNGIGLDVALAGLPFEERVIQRSSPFDFGFGITLQTVSAEDLVVLKAFAGRPQDKIDVEGVLVRQGAGLHWEQILAELTPLCELKEAPEIVDQLIHLRDKLASE